VGCFDGSDGSINLEVNGGTPGYTYLWSNGATTQNLNNIPIGTYSVTVTDANGCEATEIIVITEPALLTASAIPTAVTCFGFSDGSIALTVNGGTTGYSYVWTTNDGSIPSGQETEQNPSGLTAGSYSVTVTDAEGCTAVASVVVTQPTQISVSASVLNLLCYGASTGTITLTVSGGTGPYTYDWADLGNPGEYTDPQNRSSLAAGTYTVTVRDNNGCLSALQEYTITAPTEIQLSYVASNISCNEGNDGSINLSVSGGVAPYTFAWTKTGNGFSAATEDITGLSAGTYDVTVKDVNNCEKTLTGIPVNQPDVLTVAVSLVKDVTCLGGSDGSATATPSGGTGPYSYLWSNGSTLQTPVNFIAGLQNVVVTDSKGCTATGSINISEPATKIELYANITNTRACAGNPSGAILLIIENGQSPFTFAWTTSNGSIPSGQEDDQNLSGLPAGTYNVTVTDALFCQSTKSVEVGIAPELVANATKVDINCTQTVGGIAFSANDGEAYAVVTGGTGPFTYSWKDINDIIIGTGSFLVGLSPGTYTVTVTDADDCTDEGSVTLLAPTCNAPQDIDDEITTCGAQIIGSVADGNTGADPDAEYLPLTLPDPEQGVLVWGETVLVEALDGNGDPILDEFGNPVLVETIKFNGYYEFTPAPGYNGTVTVNYRVENPDGLWDDATLTIYVSQMTAEVTAGNTSHVECGATNGSVTVTHTGGFGPYTYSIDGNNFVSSPTFSNLGSGIYTVFVKDSKDCIVNTQVTIHNVCLELTKTITGGNPYNTAGESVSYSFAIKNIGDVELPGPFTITDNKIGTLTNCAAGPLAIGATVTCTANYTVTTGDLSAGSITNTATATTVFNNQTFTSNQDQATAEAGNADLVTVKTLNSTDATPNVGEQVSFKITVINNGPALANGVSLTDVLPSGLTYVSHAASVGTYNTGSGLWDGFSLANGASAELIITATVNAGQYGQVITNTTTKAVSTNPDPTDNGNDLTESVAVNVILSVSDETETEGTALAFEITLNAPSSTPVTFVPGFANVTTTNADYTQSPIQYTFNGVDYFTWTSGEITIPAGTTSLTFMVPTINDIVAEPDETFTLTATVTSSNTTNPDDTGTGTILDNDQVNLTLSGFTVTETDGSQTENFVVTLDKVAQEDIVITFTTTNGTAISGSDYTAQTAVIYTIPAGSFTFNIPVEVLGDLITEPTEQFTGTIALTNANNQNVVVATPTAPSTINDDDIPAVSISKTQISGPDPVTASDQLLTYEIKVENIGSALLTSVNVSEDYPGAGAGTLSSVSESMIANSIMEIGEIWTYTATYTVTQEDIDNGLDLVNTVSVVTFELPAPTEATETTPVDQNPMLTVVKTANPQTYALAGDLITYNFTVTNTGNVTLTNVVLSDPMNGLSAILPAGPVTLAPGQQQAYTATYSITLGDLVVGSVTNNATATGKDPGNNDVFGSDNEVINEDPNEILAVDDDASSTPVNGGTGGVAVSNVLDNDLLNGVAVIPAEVTISVVSPAAHAGVSLNTTNGEVTVAPLTPGGTYYITYRICEVLNPTNCDDALVTVVVLPSADLSITKIGVPDPVTAGQQINYTLFIANSGPNTAQQVTITDAVPSSISQVQFSTNNGANWQNWVNPYVNGALASGGSFTVLIRGIVNSDVLAGTLITNTAVVSSTTFDPNAANNSATDEATVSASADLSILKTSSPNPVVAGQMLTYTLAVTNLGPSAAQDVAIQDIIQTEILNPEYSTNGVDWDPWTGTYSYGTLAYGASFSIQIRGTVGSQVLETFVLSNTGTVSSSTPDPNTGNNSSTVNTIINTVADISVVKTPSPDPVTAGNLLTYTLQVNNAGPSDARSVQLTDILPASILTPQYSIDGGLNWLPWVSPYTYNYGILPAGSGFSILVRGTVNPTTTAGSTINNTATVSTIINDPDPSDNTSSTSTPVIASADLAVVKSAPLTIIAGTQIIYTITVTNAGPSAAYNMLITDAIPFDISNPQFSTDNGNTWTTWTGTRTLASINAGGTYTLLIRGDVSASATGTLTNTALVSSDTPDPDD
jgi:uncharacterized repeat protein (TIGR01451 family)